MLQSTIAERHGGNYGLAMAIVAGSVAILICLFVAIGRETQGTVIAGDKKRPNASRAPDGASQTSDH
ncbi:hypothetical protein QNH14_02985 [Apirhabdus apintestini]|nr:hypothetical protein QNH14_02985 [Enterobacteriaceae bacterium CA-0114]